MRVWVLASLALGVLMAPAIQAAEPIAPVAESKPPAPAAAPAAPAAPSATPAPAPAAATAAPAAAQPATDAAPTSDAAFFAELGYKDAASAADAARALAIFVSEGAENVTDFEAAKTYLKAKGILPDGWLDKAKAEDPIDKGHLASLICRTLGIKGGWAMRLFGPVPRYALAECVYLELISQGADYRYVLGGELVGVIDRADRYRLKLAGKSPPELTDKISPAAEEKK